MKRTILLGVNGSQIYTGEFKIRTLSQGGKEFSASFNVGEGFNTNEIEFYRYEDYFDSLWECYDNSFKLDMLEDGEITKEEAKNNFINSICDYRDIIDCSCTNYEVDMPNGDIINFETVACGQCDIREQPNFENTVFTNKEAVFKLLEFWDNFHLKEITEAQEQETNNLLESMSSYEPYGDKFDDFIINNIKY